MKMTRAIAKHQANYCLMTLAVENVSPFRKHVLEAKLAEAVKVLETTCTECGRPLTDPESIARNMGKDCWERVSKVWDDFAASAAGGAS
jgi:hypothetical protein